jgi:hypothetical protein
VLRESIVESGKKLSKSDIQSLDRIAGKLPSLSEQLAKVMGKGGKIPIGKLSGQGVAGALQYRKPQAE